MSTESSSGDQDELPDLNQMRRELDRTVKESGAEMAAFKKMMYRLAGKGPNEPVPDGYTLFDAVDDTMQRIERLEERVGEAESKATMAVTTVGQIDDGTRPDGGPKKIDVAKRTARNELVRAALESSERHSGSGKTKVRGTSGVTVSDVQDMAKPEQTLRWQTVADAFDDLEAEWESMSVDDDPRKLTWKAEAADEALVQLVEEDLGRDDLTKRLVGVGDWNGV